MQVKRERISFDGGASWHVLVDISEPPEAESSALLLEAVWLAVLLLVALLFACGLGHLEWAAYSCGVIVLAAVAYFAVKNVRVRRARAAARKAYQEYKDSLEWRTEQIRVQSSIPRLLNTSRGLVQLSDEVYQEYMDLGAPPYAMYSELAPRPGAKRQ